jgi:acyl-CoA reductase-like NAD-dependent aldehyde dehydrogenase
MNANDMKWVERAEGLALCIRNFVNGRWKDLDHGDRLEKYSPRDGRLLARFGASEAREIDEVVTTARHAFEDGRWSALAAQRRKDILHRLGSLIEAHREELALLECLDVGKPISDALAFDIPAVAATLRFCAEAIDKFYGKVYAVDTSSLSYELHRPLGVVSGIVGWNFPLLLAASKIGPALATGNSLVLKPSELTSFSTARLAELAIEAGVPEGVFNVIHGGASVGAALARHRDVDGVTFTGSTRTGKQLMVAAGESNLKHIMLECGGKAPNIVFDDCPDVGPVADAIVARAFWNQGQVCSASSRLLVQENIKAELLPILIERTAELRPGDPLVSETTFGAVVSRAHQQKIQSYIANGEEEGARIAYRCNAPPPYEDGFYVPPVIFDEVSPNQKIAQEEIFGPVLSVISFRDEEEAIQIANSTIYGLSAIVWTRDLRRAHRMARGIKAGWVVVNATGKPSGGPGYGVLAIGGHKESGLGVEGGVDGLQEYVSKTAVQMFV